MTGETKTMESYRVKFAAPVLIATAVATVFWVSAGQLEPPPGAINPTGPTTINGQGITLPYMITESGSYLLTSNIEAPPGHTGNGIIIEADNVTLDLGGFTVKGPGAGTGIGVVADSQFEGITIKNGTVRGWGDGVRFYGGDPLQRASNRLQNLVAVENGGYGFALHAEGSHEVINCTALGNGGIGIGLPNGGLVTGCTSFYNADSGFAVGDSSTLSDCTAHSNGSDGIIAADSATVTECTATSNGSDGITVMNGSVVSRCAVYGNSNHGIKALYDCLIVSNECAYNNAAGIYIEEGQGNRIEATNVFNCVRGIHVGHDNGRNVIMKNSAGENPGGNYVIGAGNSYGPIVNVVNVGDISSTPGADHPWANFEY